MNQKLLLRKMLQKKLLNHQGEVYFLCESFFRLDFTVRFLMTLTYTIIGKVLYAAMKEHRKTPNDKIKMFSFKKIEIASTMYSMCTKF